MACSIIRNKQTNEIEQVLAPNGKESKLYKDILKINPDKEAALRSWAQVYTPSFKAWFGDWETSLEKTERIRSKDPSIDDITIANLYKDVSKVVDDNGEPLLVYHGSDKKFDTFDTSRSGDKTGWAKENKGFHFFNNKTASETYLNSKEDAWGYLSLWVYLKQYAKSGKSLTEQEFKNILEDNTKLANVLEGAHYFGAIDIDTITYDQYNKYAKVFEKDKQLDDYSSNNLDMIGTDVTEKYENKEASVMPVFLNIKTPLNHDSKGKRYVSDIKTVYNKLNNSNDGIIVENTLDRLNDSIGFEDTVYVAFEPNQIKSAFNQGTFSEKTGNIYNLIIKNPEDFDETKNANEANNISSLILNKLKLKTRTFTSKSIPNITSKEEYLNGVLKDLLKEVGLPEDITSVEDLRSKLNSGEVISYIQKIYDETKEAVTKLEKKPSVETLKTFLKNPVIDNYDAEQQNLIRTSFPALFGELGRYKSYAQALAHYKIRVNTPNFLESNSFHMYSAKLKKYETLLNYYTVAKQDFNERIPEFIANELKRRSNFYDSAPVKENIEKLLTEEAERKYQKSVKGILERLSENENAVSGKLAKVFLSHRKTINAINIEDIRRTSFAGFSGGMWDSDGNITVNYNDEKSLRHILMHELTHHFSVPYMHAFYKNGLENKEWYSKNPERTPKLEEDIDGKYLFQKLTDSEIESMSKIDAIYRHVIDLYKSGKISFPKTASNSNPEYGLTDAYEFIAEAISNPYFAATLSEIPSMYGKKSNLLKDFLDLILKLLGINDGNLLEDVYSLFEEGFLNKDDNYTFSNKPSEASTFKVNFSNQDNNTYLQKEDKYSYANLLKELSNDLKQSLLYNNKLNYEVSIDIAGEKVSFPHMWIDEKTGKLKKDYENIPTTIIPDQASLNLYSIFKFNKRYDDLKPVDKINVSDDVFLYLNPIGGSSISLKNYEEIKDLENVIFRLEQYYSDSLKDINEISIAGEDVFYYKVKDQWYETNTADENTKSKGVPVKESKILLERDKELKKYKEDLDKLLKDANVTGKSQIERELGDTEEGIDLKINSNINNKIFRSFFDNKNITDVVEGLDLPGGINLQKEKQSERPSNEELNKKIKRFLTTIGVSASVVDEIRDREGNLIDAIAKADILNKVIEVLNGTDDITTLPEEAAHFFVEMLGENHPLYRQMAEKITSYAIYKDTVDKYKDDRLYRNQDGTINFNKLKKEAMGKLIMQHIIERFDEDESVKRVEAARSWWKKVWDYIKSIFNKGEKINEQLDNPFAISAKKILESDATDLDMQFKSDQEYLQKSTTGEEAFKKAKDLHSRMTLDDSIDPVTGKNKHVYVKDGKPVVDADGTARSVNENVVKPWYKRRFPTDKRSDIQKVIDDLKAEFGTGLHKEIEKILDRYIDKDTGLVRATAIPGQKLNVNAEVEKKLNTYISGLVRSYPAGARFLAEARIFNEKKNLPGTVDLIVFLPDGSADIYDWKSQEVMDGETELKWFKEPAYRLQLEEYRQAIEQQFGVTKFNKIRAIPIRTVFQMSKLRGAWVPQDLKDIEIGPVDPALVPESKEYLLPVVAEKESTGDKELDKLISRLNIIYETLNNKSSKDKDKKNIELNKIKKTIRNLQVKKDIKHFTESGLLEIDKYYDKLINNNIGISEILEARDIINVYNEGADYLESLLIKLNKSIDVEQDLNKKNELLSLQDKFKTMILRAGSLVNRLEKRGKELADEEASKNGIKGLLNPERVMDYLKRNFRALSQLETTAAQAFYKIRNKAFQVRDAETEDMNENLAKLKDDLEKWASANGISKDKIFDGILETDKNGKRTGDFLDMYSDKFRELKKAAIKRGDVAWIRANTVFDNEAYIAAFKKYQEVVEGSIYSADPKLDREKKDAAILRWIETHNGEKSDTAALLPKGNFLRPKDIWWSDKYKALNKKENAPLKAVYDKFQSMLRDSEKAGMIDYEFGFIPSIMRTKMEAFVLGDMGKTGDKSSFLQSLAVDSSVDFGQLDINGKQVKKIPVYYTNDLGADKSFDLFKVFSIWGTHTSNYKAMSSIEDTANLLLFVEQNKQSLQTNRFGKVKKGAEPVNDNKVNAEVLENFINYYVYGQKLDAADDFSFKVGGTEISATRGLQKLLRYFSIKTLALNPISGTANLVGGTANASFVAKKNLYFGDKDWAWGQYKLASRDEKAMAFLDYTQVELENQAFYNSNQLSMSDVMKNWTSDKFFIIQRTGDKLVTYPVALAMFRTHMVDKDGKIVSIRNHVKAKNNYEGIYNLPSNERKKILEQIDKEIEELTESSSLYAKSKKVNGKLEIEGVDRKSDTFIEFRNKIKKMNKSIIGNSSQEDINQFRIGMLGQMVMQFRSWIPGLVTERFGDLAYDTDLETYNYGKARVFFKHFVDQKFLPLLGELITGFGDNAIDRAKARYAEMVIRKREQGDENFEERMSETQFIDMYIANLRSMTREMMVMLAFLCLVLWSHTVPPDEDKEHNGARKLMAKAMDKYYNEVAFFYNPTEFQSLIKSPIPITGLFTDIAHFGEHTIKEVWGLGTGNEKLVKKSHPMKYFNKMIPVAKQVQDIFALFDKEFRTEWGIKT